MNKNFMDKFQFLLMMGFVFFSLFLGMFVAYKLGAICEEIRTLKVMTPLTPMLVDKS